MIGLESEPHAEAVFYKPAALQSFPGAGNSTGKGSLLGMMVDHVVCQLGSGTVPRCLVKHYSRYFCEGIFGDGINS